MTFEEDIKSAVETLRNGGIIIYPTDTIWGIGCDATNEKAVSKLYALKQRCEAKACISLVNNDAMLERYLMVFPEAAEMLIEAAVDPLTIIYDSPLGLAPQLIAEDGSAAMRITHEKYSAELCKRLRRPIVSTSANISGTPSPALFTEITGEILENADYVAEYRRDEKSSAKPSSIIKVRNNGVIKIIRK